MLRCSPVGGTFYLHGGVDNEDATTCAEGLFMFTPGLYLIQQ